ncbi:transposase [Streptomyces sp. NPDC059832]|uniref:transposase n=1 Tax=Streptomyces sp. NPDC059832 TaxID=3346966 RepID=UPI003660DF9B
MSPWRSGTCRREVADPCPGPLSARTADNARSSAADPHGYVRPGTTTPSAAPGAATGKATGSLHRRHRTEEYKKFLIKLDQEVPAGLWVHLVLDNYATRKAPAIKTRLLTHPRFHLHFTPTGSSWLNLVERWFAELTNKQVRPGVHREFLAQKTSHVCWSPRRQVKSPSARGQPAMPNPADRGTRPRSPARGQGEHVCSSSPGGELLLLIRSGVGTLTGRCSWVGPAVTSHVPQGRPICRGQNIQK